MSMNMQTLITNFQQQLITIRKTESAEFFNLRNSWLNKLIPQLEDYDRDELKILKNEHLTQNGKMTAVRELAEKFTPSLSWLKNLEEKHEKDTERFQANLFAVKSPVGDAVVRELRNGEVRRQFSGLKASERDAQFLRAADQDNDEVLDALLSGPMGRLISDEVQRRGLESRAKRRQPEMYAAYELNALAVEYVQMLVEVMGRRLAAVGVAVEVIRKALGDRVGDMLTVQRTGVVDPRRDHAGAGVPV